MAAFSVGNALCLMFFIVYFHQGKAVIRRNGYCVAYGNIPVAEVPNQYNGPAKKSPDLNHYNLLKETCPYLSIAGFNATTSCCDTKQLEILKKLLATSAALLGRCPACLRNFRDLWCEITCSPNQSTFFDYQQYVMGEFYMSTTFAEGLYDSCRDVIFPGTGNKVMDIMCGTMAKYCTKEKFLSFIGSPSNGAPFLINFKINETATNITLDDHPIKRCNESFVDEGSGKNMSACFSVDCRDSSFHGPTLPPPPARGPELIITINSTNSFAVDNYQPYQKSEKFSFSGLIQKTILGEILQLHQGIKDLRVNTSKNSSIQLNDLCVKPNGTECKIESILQYFQLDASNLNKCITNMAMPCGPRAIGARAEDWHDQIIGCTRSPYSKSNGNYLRMSCLSTYGQPVLSKDVLKGYERTLSNITAESILIRLAVNISTPEHIRNITVFKDGLETLLNSWESSAGQKFNFTASVVYSKPSAPVTTASPMTTVPMTTAKPSNGVLLKSSFYEVILAHLLATILYYI